MILPSMAIDIAAVSPVAAFLSSTDPGIFRPRFRRGDPAN